MTRGADARTAPDVLPRVPGHDEEVGMRSRRHPARPVVALLAAGALTAASSAASPAVAPTAAPASTTGTHPHVPAPAYPLGTLLPEPVTDPDDASLRLGLAPHHDLARRLNALVATSDRVSTQVVGSSVEGRDLVLVTLTAPEGPDEAREQDRLRDRILVDPVRAARDQELRERYKVPVLITANLHGNEWEGTDAALRLVEEWATSDDPDVLQTLESTRVHLMVSANPDGRVGNSRRNAAGFDLNRDLLTVSQPETRALRDVVVRTQPAMVLDVHGYVNGPLVEPTTPPHGENYEYDLFLKHAWPNALGIEEAILELGLDDGDGVRPPQVPLRDWDEGWDDWPPIFLPQYAALHGAVAHTVEVPLRVNNASYDLPEEELRRRAAVNVDVARAAMGATLDYVRDHREELIADQVEIFRRGTAGEAQRPVPEGLFGVVGPEDVSVTEYPRAYVVPAGGRQRSAPAAARLVRHLLDHGVQVERAEAPVVVDGTTYPEGSWVVDLHQARRGVAHALLGQGTDLSDRVETMYDISGWSLGLLWGADVVPVRPGSGDGWDVPRAPVGTVPGQGQVAPSSRGWVLELADPADVRALGQLLSWEVGATLLPDGTVHLPVSAAWAVEQVADDHGVHLAGASAAQAEAAGTEEAAVLARPPVVGVAATAEERWVLTDMGLTVRPVGTDELNEGLDLSDLDTLYVSTGLALDQLDEEARAEVRSFLAEGGGLVARGAAANHLEDALDLLDVTVVAGPGDANGVVAVTDEDGPVAGDGPGHTFVYGPRWFTDLPDDVHVEQRFADDPLVSGHWRPGGTGPDAAAGEAVLVRGTTDSGGRVVLIGSEPLFRAHPLGQHAVVARALLWTGLLPP
ncbi:M14 family zinc carboxypeptidase [Ornithinimicrobium kibberense]|uniref:M14 family zinc carboxypeptidase n=2 Tax=Ornithinimicrobium kibberense TaxID=282060 RepID=A0ABV5UZX2_9MICO